MPTAGVGQVLAVPPVSTELRTSWLSPSSAGDRAGRAFVDFPLPFLPRLLERGGWNPGLNGLSAHLGV